MVSGAALAGASAKPSPKDSSAGFCPGAVGGGATRGGSPGPSRVVTTQPERHGANSRTSRAAQLTFADLGPDGKLELYDELSNVRRLAELDDDAYELVRRVLFDFDEPGRGNLPAVDAFHAAVLLEVLKDLLYQAYVRRGRLQQAMMVRRYFAEGDTNVTPLPGSRS